MTVGARAETPSGTGLRGPARVAGLAGLAFAVLFVVGFTALNTLPGPSAPDDEILRFYDDQNKRQLSVVGAYIVPFSAIAFLWFIAALRTLLVDPNEQRSETLSRVQLAAGILFVAGAFVAAATASAAATSIEFFESSETDPALLRQLPQLGYSVMFVFTIRMAGMFIAVTSRLGRWLLPGWLTVIGYLLAAVLVLTVPFSELIALVFPAWVIVLCAWLLLGPGRERGGAEAALHPGR